MNEQIKKQTITKILTKFYLFFKIRYMSCLLKAEYNQQIGTSSFCQANVGEQINQTFQQQRKCSFKRKSTSDNRKVKEYLLPLVSNFLLYLILILSQIQNVSANPYSQLNNFINFTMNGNLQISQDANIIMEFNQQAYYKLSNYFINLEINNQNSPVFLCLCVAKNCQVESLKWTFDALVFYSKQNKGQSLQNQLKSNPIICNIENYYHSSTERELYININSQIQEIYQQNQHLGIIIRSQTNLNTSYTLSLQQKRNFCRKCLNIVQCDSSSCICECQAGFFGQYCSENAVVFKLGLGADDMTQSAYQLKQKVFAATLQLSNLESNTNLRSLQQNHSSPFFHNSNNEQSYKTSNSSSPLIQTSKSTQYIKLEVQPFLDMTPNITYTNFYISLSKNSNDQFKLFVADQYQINSSYISQNDFVQEIDFNAGETDIYIEIYAYNREYPKQKVLEKITQDPIGKSAVIKQMKTYRIMLQFDPQQAQNYQLLLVNQCEKNNASCLNQVQINYSLSDFLFSPITQVKSNLTYMIVFLSITFAGMACFCCYSIYKNYQKKRIQREQEKIKKSSNTNNNESQFKQIRQKVEAQAIQDEEMHKMRDQTVVIEVEAKSISNLQLNNPISHTTSTNKILDVKNQYSVNKFNIVQASRVFQSNLIKLQKQESDGKSNTEIAARSQSRFNSQQENKVKMKQLYNTNSELCEQDKRIERINQILEQNNQLQICTIQNQNLNIQTNQQPNSPNKIKKELKLEQATTQNTYNNLGCHNISNNFNEISSNNTTVKQNSNKESLNNTVYLKKQTDHQDGEYDSTCLNQQRASKASIPSEDSHALPQINNNHARPVYHYEIQQIEQKKEQLKAQQKPQENCLGYQTLNYITTNSSNTINQIFSNLDFENQSPIDNLMQGQRVPLITRPELTKYLSNQNNQNLNSAVFLVNNPSKTNQSSHAQLNINESSSEEEESSQLKNDKKMLPNIKEENYNITQEKEEQQEADYKKLNSQQQQYDLSQNIENICEGYPAELKAIDGSKIQSHRRKILSMGVKKEINNQDTEKADAKENELLLICQQEISNIMLKKKNEMDSINNSVNNGAEDLEKGVRLDQLIYEEKDDNQSISNDGIQKLDFFKIETPEIFFQNCPKCQSKQHEFQLKLSNFGEQGVKPKDKYCSLCLMKAEMSEVKMADSF
ncbi:transmembrane protein, putative (macronuclear) [Tetrahymena thermophila SB210]|uniref:Transmembrane protein, putative n=1 Tax=Tetrahymena thermophila (strain SB210) TaxID=312017 RepID=Q248H2_TETTS|nr:transmembrane protein, putative [Tetrahymena thermophila SB210]EAS04073.2 transmembrane protein, putative [Tetrahymena thermophila SB210]|eukprot:XP_001024318.2 transmembrane protein, putative [Tetrahymena thermophila SB210]